MAKTVAGESRVQRPRGDDLVDLARSNLWA